MKAGRDVHGLLEELERQSTAKRDLVVNHAGMQVDLVDNTPQLNLGNGRLRAPMNTIAHRQLGEHLKIPAKYYDRMLEFHPELLMDSINTWLRDDQGERRMVRLLFGQVRALLSNSYRPLDNLDLARAVLPVLRETGAEVRSCEVTERKLYIKAVVPGMKAEIPPPGVQDWQWGKEHHAIDVVEAGIEIGNSEVGFGSLFVAPGVHTVQCSNLAVFSADKMRKTHLGKALELGELEANTSNTTRALEDAALWSKMGDLVRASLGGELFHKYVTQLREARGQVIEGAKVEPLFEEVGTRLALTEDERKAAFGHFIEGEDLTRYGVAAAITRMAQDVDSYDRSTELEHAGGDIIELPKNQWEVLLKAA